MAINNNDVKKLLEKINKVLSQYENMPDDEKISRMISENYLLTLKWQFK